MAGGVTSDKRDGGGVSDAVERRRAQQREYRARKRAERNSPEAKARQAEWEQRLADIGQAAIERRENMPGELRIIGRN